MPTVFLFLSPPPEGGLDLVTNRKVAIFIYYRYASTGSTLPALSTIGTLVLISTLPALLVFLLHPYVDSVLVFCTEAGEAG